MALEHLAVDHEVEGHQVKVDRVIGLDRLPLVRELADVGVKEGRESRDGLRVPGGKEVLADLAQFVATQNALPKMSDQRPLVGPNCQREIIVSSRSSTPLPNQLAEWRRKNR